MGDGMTTLAGGYSSPLTIDAVVAQMVADATTTRWLGPFDAREVSNTSGWTTTAQQAGPARLRYRNGNPVGGATAVRFDLGATTAQTLLATSVYQSLADYEFAGFSLGSVLDACELGYDPPTAADREHVPHGGAYRARGVRAMLDALPAGAVTTDRPQEFVAHQLDLAHDFDLHYPRHLEMAEETLRGLSVLDQPAAARDMSPALWQAVYGDRVQVGRLLPPLTRIGRSDSIYHPDGDGQWTGLTATQWAQLLAWQAATCAVQGIAPILQMPAAHYAHRVQSDSAEAIVDLVLDLQAFLRGPLVTFSRGDLPLRLGREVNTECNRECGAGPDTATNPAYYARQVSPTVVADAIPPLMERYYPGGECSSECSTECSRSPATGTTGWGALHQSFPVRSVVHAVRRDPETGDLCLVLVNWTSAAAAWSGWLAPWFYSGFGGPVSRECSSECPQVSVYRVDSLDSTGAATAVATDLADATLLTCSGISGTLSGRQLSLGSVPAYSVRAYRIRATT